ncbi:hypothetical protein [Nocardiopsis halophila]|uniref:hypothetical protein n=1 Tax=Nocardiopsis halophila TaxID=141692 RepID=UPI0003487158|nr:hypothetical protein [Nocardiopsis halophila]
MSTTDVIPDQSHYSPISEHTPATRHLCAGVYSDRAFSDLVIRVHNAAHRRLAPSYDFDLVPVMRHAWIARALEASVHLAIVMAVLLPWVTGHPWSAVLVGLALSACLAVHVEVRRAKRAVWGAFDDSSTLKEDREKARFRMPSFRPKILDDPLGFALWRLIPLRYQRYFKAGVLLLGFTALSWVLRPEETALAAEVLLGLVFAVGTIGAVRQYLVNRLRTRDDLRPARKTPREKMVVDQQDPVCVVYRRGDDALKDTDGTLPRLSLYGRVSPFVGAGDIVSLWNPPITVQLMRRAESPDESRQEREFEVPPFKAHELVDHLRRSMAKLDRDTDDVRLQCQIRDRVYVSETDMTIDRSLLDADVARTELDRIIDTVDHKAHHFLEASASSAGGELVSTVLLRVSLKGRTLSLDSAACALPRSLPEFQRINRYAEFGAAAIVLAALRAVRTLPGECGRLHRLAKLPVQLLWGLWAQRDWSLVRLRGVLIGPKTAVREQCAEDLGDVQLDQTRLSDHIKIVQKHLLNSVRDFLVAHEVDTADFEERVTQIINASVVNVGGMNQFANNAIGFGAQANNTMQAQQAGQVAPQ